VMVETVQENGKKTYFYSFKRPVWLRFPAALTSAVTVSTTEWAHLKLKRDS
jgi:hypothetical protein